MLKKVLMVSGLLIGITGSLVVYQQANHFFASFEKSSRKLVRNKGRVPSQIRILYSCLLKKGGESNSPALVGFLNQTTPAHLVKDLKNRFSIPRRTLRGLTKAHKPQDVCLLVHHYLLSFFAHRAISFVDFATQFDFDSGRLEETRVVSSPSIRRKASARPIQNYGKPIKKRAKLERKHNRWNDEEFDLKSDSITLPDEPGGPSIGFLSDPDFDPRDDRDSVIDNDVRVESDDPYYVYDEEREHEGNTDILAGDFD